MYKRQTNGSLSGLIAGDTVTLTSSGSFTDKNAATGKTVNVVAGALSGADAGNYVLTGSNTSTTADIVQANLTIIANNASKIADGIPYAGGNGVRYLGFVGAEDASVLGGTLAYGGSAQGATNAGNYNINPSGLTSGNYLITYNDGTLTIIQGGAISQGGKSQPPSAGQVSMWNQTMLTPDYQVSNVEGHTDLYKRLDDTFNLHSNRLSLYIAPEYLRADLTTIQPLAEKTNLNGDKQNLTK